MTNALLQLPLYTTPAQQSATDITYASNGSGDLLILVHGSLCDLRYWRWQLTKLPSHCQVVALSLPGYWQDDLTSVPHEFDYELHLAAIADVVQALRQPEQKLYVLGHSRGAQLAANYVWQHREEVEGLILADPAFIPNHPSQPLSVIDEAAQLLINGEEDTALALFIDAVSGKDTWRQMVGWFKTMIQDNAHTLIEQSKESLPLVKDTQLQQLAEVPTLLINGAHSPTRYHNSTQALLKHLPHAQHTLINNASHGMNLANPKAFNKAVLGFIQALT